LILTREEVEIDVATHLSTVSGNEVVLFGTEEASHWNVETVTS